VVRVKTLDLTDYFHGEGFQTGGALIELYRERGKVYGTQATFRVLLCVRKPSEGTMRLYVEPA
jgi:hypothetical protein